MEVLPVYLYEVGTELRLLSSSGAWEHYLVHEPPAPLDSETTPARRLEPGAASTYSLMPIAAGVGAEAREIREMREACISVELTKRNHALVLDPGMEMRAEYLKYVAIVPVPRAAVKYSNV